MGKAKRLYLKIKNIDTLYFREYSSDSSKVTDIIKTDSASVIQGFPCRSITLKRESGTSRYLYTDALQLNTEFEKDKTLENLNVLISEIGTAMWLYNKTDYKGASITDSCVQVDQSPVDNHLFDLPALPQKNLSVGSLIRLASFRGGEKTASVKVLVSFYVAADGSLSNIEVTNKAEVDSHLANEAMRAIRESPAWDAATIYGIKVKTPCDQPIVFAVTQ